MRLTSTRTPIVASRAPLWATLKMVAAGPTEFGQVTGSAINIVNPGHPLAGGLVDSVNVTVSPATIKWGHPAASAAKVATVPDQPNNITIFGYPTGSAMLGGLTAPGRRVGWFADAELPRVLSSDGWKLFDAAIRWAGAPDATLAGSYALKAVHSGKCVDVSGGSVANGAGLVQADCSGATSQRWVLRDLGAGLYEASSVNSNRCAAVSGAGTANGVPVVQNTCSGASNQKWKLIAAGNGQYQLQAASSVKCMDISGMSTASGALVQQWTCTAGNNQRFQLVSGSNCAPESTSNFCARLGKNCGTVTGIDNCGMQRTAASCGTCQAPATCGDDTTPNVCRPTCSFTITQNVYDGPTWWGTIGFRNNGPAPSSNYSVEFHVPAGTHCTNDAVPPGATLSPLDSSGASARTIANHCVFHWASAAPIAAGATMTMNYSTDSQNFSAASDVIASDSVCQ
jgi:hypothetical protein